MNDHPEALHDVAEMLEVGTGKNILDSIRADFRMFIEEEEEELTSGLGCATPRNLLIVPLLEGSQLKGIIELASFGTFSDENIADIESLASLVAAGITSKQGEEKIRSLLSSTQQQSAELVSANEELEQKRNDLNEQQFAMQERNVALEQARSEIKFKARELAMSVQYKSDFLANMSHEIRTPMTAILGFTEIFREKATDAESRDWLEKIQRNGDHLLSIINDILDISKIEADKLKIEVLDVSPSELLLDVAELMSVRASGKGLTLQVEFDGPIPKSIKSDPTRLRQILFNLAGNAIKFTEVGAVRIVARVLDTGSDEPRLQFDVVDSGIGMSEDQVGNLFQPFVQADSSTSRKFGGTGLGLTISKRLSEIQGGGIDDGR
ncbi:MAG: histidine kinase dimerization/phospho-acceptor domain-containing protein [Fuerstiella sp.]